MVHFGVVLFDRGPASAMQRVSSAPSRSGLSTLVGAINRAVVINISVAGRRGA